MTDKKVSLRRGRPRAFNEKVVIQRAQQIFLEEGFEAVSYEHLATEVGLSKPSLYNAFGDKSALFERVLENYAQVAVSFSVAQFESGETLEDGARKFLLAAADLYSQPGTTAQGCLLVGTALPACAKPGNVRQTLGTFIEALDGSLEAIIAMRYKEDAQNLDRSPQILAMHLSSLLFSLAIRARTGMTRQELRVVAGELSGLITK